MFHLVVRRLRVALPLFLCFAWAGSGCDAASESAAVDPAFDASVLSGEELFSGIVLGDGPAAYAIPELWGAREVRAAAAARAARDEGDPEAASALATLREDVVASIAASDPAFFDRFKADVTSGSPLRVQHALREAGSTILSEFATVRRRIDDQVVVIYAVDSQTILDVDLDVDQQTVVFVFYMPPTLPLGVDSPDVSTERVAALIAERLNVPGR